MRTRDILRTAITVCIVCLSVSTSAFAGNKEKEDENPYLWQPRVTSVAVFKNGLGFVMSEGEVELRDGWCVAKRIPPALFGTLAIYSHKEGEIVDIIGAGPGEIVDFDGNDAPEDDAAKRKRIEACSNLNVELTYKDSERKAAGRVVSVGKDFVVLDNGTNSLAVPVADINRMQVLDMPLRIHVVDKNGNSPKKTKLGMAYLRKGFTWIPEYTLQVRDDKKADLTLRGTLVNVGEDLIHCDVNFVVGVPHFAHTGYMAPIAVGQMIRTIGAAVAPPQVRTQIATRAAITSNIHTSGQFDVPGVVDKPLDAGSGDAMAALGNVPKFQSVAGTDYTVYKKADLTLRRGEKAIVTLFKREIEYGHFYRWSPPGRVRHFLVLKNSTDTAWTTGPCLAISEGHPLSEDLLKYTPKGGKAEFPVAAAINISTEKSESELTRKLKAHQPSHNVWLDLVTLKGELKVKNFEKRTIRMVITLDVPGKPTEASNDGKLTIDTTKLVLRERKGQTKWLIELKPGETKTLSYVYDRYVPSN